MLSELSPEHREILLHSGTSRHYRKGTLLISEGDAPGAVFMIESGRVRIFVGDEAGREVTLRDLGPGEFFGELAIIDEAPRSASAVTIEDSKMVTISQPAFEACLRDNANLALDLARLMAQRVRGLTGAVKDLALLDVCGRIESTLVKLGEAQSDGTCLLRQVPTQQDLANRVGASREMVSKVMKTLYLAHRIERCREGLRVQRDS